MAQSHVLYALRRKCAKTLGELKAAHADRVRLMSELAHLGAVIRLFAQARQRNRGAPFGRRQS